MHGITSSMNTTSALYDSTGIDDVSMGAHCGPLSSSSTIEGTGISNVEQVMIAVISRLIRFPSEISRRHYRVDLRVSLEGEREVEKV